MTRDRMSRIRAMASALVAVLPDVLSLGVGVLALPVASLDPVAVVAALVLVTTIATAIVLVRSDGPDEADPPPDRFR